MHKMDTNLNDRNKEFKFMHIPEYTEQPRAYKNLFVFEKIDGGNCSVRKEKGIIAPHSRSRRLTQQDLGSFYFRNFFDWTYSTLELQDLPEDKILCGEWTHYGFGHICYNPEYMDRFFLLGVFDKSKERYLHPNETDNLINSLNLDDKIVRLPVLCRGDINKELADELSKEPSNFYNGPKEGIVIHKYGLSFKQGLRMEKHFNPEFREIGDIKTGIERYVTRRRLVKAAQNLRTYGKNLNFENVISAAVNYILRDSKEYKKEDLLEAFLEPEIKTLFFEKIIPLFKKKEK